ncbi:hypothetical protein LTR37_004583 [Vermiconidia calcicola]|uniref:Uncharacterized protein n=1 Tax=Vermiconidia calcicola TaxID=1690605 RepID=A0ACC3NMM9_9PEZI|nr:hypothetical protein LTR37_004583 [Vermiconidia calcicola]
MDGTKWPAIIGLVIGTVCLSRTVPTTFAFDKPLLSYSVLLASAAISVLALGRYLKRVEGRWTSKEGGQQYHALPLDEVISHDTSAQPSSHQTIAAEDVRYPSSQRKLRIISLALIGAICFRVEILRNVLANTQCNVLTWEPLLPFLFAAWDYYTLHRHTQRPAYDDPHSSVYDALEQRAVRSQFRYLVTAGLVSFGGLLAIATTRSPASTYICAATLSNRWLVPFLQRIGTGLDAGIAYCVTQLLHERDVRPAGSGQRSAVTGLETIASATVRAAQISVAWLCFLGVIYMIAEPKPQGRTRMLELPWYYVWSLVKLDFLFCMTLACAFLAVSVHNKVHHPREVAADKLRVKIFHVGLTTVLTITTFVSICTLTTNYASNNLLAFPPSHSGLAFFAICIAMLGFTTYLHFETLEHKTFGNHPALFTKKVSSWLYLALLILFLTRAAFWASQSTSVNYHPIDLLMYDAQFAHEVYIKQASSSTNLAEAVQNYKERYNRHPPPGFDHWYRYATSRHSIINDDYDSIERDILPFYALEPAEVRHRTWQLLANEWNDATGISIRSGKVEVIGSVWDTHKWMVEGLVRMIGQFAEWLPDMDLAFNVNDEPRISVPYADIEQMLLVGHLVGHYMAAGTLEEKPRNAFTDNRAQQWEPISEEKSAEKIMQELSWQRTFHKFAAASCPPSSQARSHRLWNRGNLCTSCAAPHSIGAFLANWTKAADICHQPDLADLHGIFTSPSAARVTHKLYPIFSQSKVNGFNDILYPSAWNWLGKAEYAPTEELQDPEYKGKETALFWRGATSEGMSPDRGQWKGMARQRFLHILNDINVGGATQAILLPSGSNHTGHVKDPSLDQQKTSLAYRPIPISDLTAQIKTDVHFAGNRFTRCWDIDCPQQASEFGLEGTTPFQQHWRYKFLLDLDGAGFSGRFLPFLQSRSLPFKAAVFREWWDDRVTAWWHFVPLDVRGHGVWATLAYFAGWDGGRGMRWSAHEAQGEKIAGQGREWARKVLRKEDMEIYFFRLLLEWGRVTDDWRDEIGFDA